MTTQDPDTFFPELEGDERSRADEWLRDYLSLVVRIYRESKDAKLSTAPPLTDAVVQARSVRPKPGPTHTQ
jgi:hypothetical protein